MGQQKRGESPARCTIHNKLTMDDILGEHSVPMSLNASQENCYPDHRIEACPHTMHAHSPLPGEHSIQVPFYKRSLTTMTFLIVPGTHLTPGGRDAM